MSDKNCRADEIIADFEARRIEIGNKWKPSKSLKDAIDIALSGVSSEKAKVAKNGVLLVLMVYMDGYKNLNKEKGYKEQEQGQGKTDRLNGGRLLKIADKLEALASKPERERRISQREKAIIDRWAHEAARIRLNDPSSKPLIEQFDDWKPIDRLFQKQLKDPHNAPREAATTLRMMGLHLTATGDASGFNHPPKPEMFKFYWRMAAQWIGILLKWAAHGSPTMSAREITKEAFNLKTPAHKSQMWAINTRWVSLIEEQTIFEFCELYSIPFVSFEPPKHSNQA